ncbi:hypothetical protein DWB61_03635 [Ancylomarina euxinus]|uniref:DUF47 family protein n=1 Tax=Ancylomarina euxinus TaxID=2283627 RepID=A0A425Y6S7_9BACT|nr:hypothetical protein [Ancylomarina euxinus]MCZ4693908.1 hypothetical protein [Ancylomarina euxinus]MUP14671.1 hypothetical protein [Ancylomarina euxinus]RRG24217.1 hypothetical protein DWB61_03635 [Ancylomarina euxinus]
MASRRNFKKDVNFLTNEIFMRSIIHLEFFGKRNSDEVYNIMNEAADARNNYIARINQKVDKKADIKSHFKLIYDDLLKSTHELLEKIDNLDID